MLLAVVHAAYKGSESYAKTTKKVSLLLQMLLYYPVYFLFEN
jgi:hypothetical protein